jgi:mono/diheme cytochrome c family protein
VVAERYGLTPAELMEMNCNRCHQRQGEVAGMPLLNDAKAQVAQRRCNRCHVVNGEGKTFAPDLTREGDKHPSRLSFPDGWPHERTALRWHVEHLLDPESTSPGSTMQKFRLTRREATALALLVLSWREPALPAGWIPPPVPPLPTPPPRPGR